VLETSADDGKTWSRHVVPAASVAAAGGFGGAGIHVAADPSARGRYAVLVPATASLAEIWVTSDSGTTWTRALSIGGAGSDTVTKPWIAYGPTGTLGVVWRNMHSDNRYDVYATVSADGGKTFNPKIELTPGSAPPDNSPGPLGDDCACNLALNNDYIYTTWADSRNAHRQVWFASYRLTPAAASSPGSAGQAASAPESAGKTARPSTVPATGESVRATLAGIGALLLGLGLVALRRRATTFRNNC
jgi:LPXTG-motif cell wall-anchored protein